MKVERPAPLVAGAVVTGMAVWFVVLLVAGLGESEAGFVVWVVNLSVSICLGLAGAFMIRSGLRGRDVIPQRPAARRGGCLGSVVGGIAFFFLCFSLTPEGEGQLGCLVAPLVGAFVGAVVGAGIGAVVDHVRGGGPARQDGSSSGGSGAD